ncbi:winged helix DNA-binding domain-containing protein [Gordonia alkaliphila]|uniref:Winged helix DNA-binding domain-containing protein n=1 Tax=Gordonia alkaliphila TaxID=1053547 RepID=A0ABP8YYY4_9ACTN
MAITVTREQVIAFRARRHHLTAPASNLASAAGACGIGDSPPGAALLALGARLPTLTAQDLDDALDSGALIRTWSMRGAPFLVPVADLPVFTTGVLGATEDVRAQLIRGVIPALATLDLTLDEAVARCRDAVTAVLAGRRMPIGPLGAEAAAAIAPQLSTERRRHWLAEGPHAPGQPLGEAVVHFCLRILTLERLVCFAPREGNTAPFVLCREWLGDLPAADPERARAELVRRYLRCYGPSTRHDFAAWLGVRTGDTGGWWSLIDDELTAVDYDGEAWLLTADLDDLRESPPPRGVHLLPALDPYLGQRDRATIVDPAHHRAVFTNLEGPGAVLVDGRVAGTWRPRKRGTSLTLTVTEFTPLTDEVQSQLTSAAERMAHLRGADIVHVLRPDD